MIVCLMPRIIASLPSISLYRMRNPVLLLHGIDDTAELFSTMTPFLQQWGWSVHSLDLCPNNGDAGLEELAQQVADYVAQAFPPDQPFDLVGFSMGGIVGRYYVQRLGGLDRIHRFVTISSPHNGTWAAYVRPNKGGSQMRINSPFLTDLNRDVHRLEQINFTSIWTPLDLIILPATSSRLPVGREVQLWVPAHSWMVRSLQSLTTVAMVLSEPLRKPQLTNSTAGVV